MTINTPHMAAALADHPFFSSMQPVVLRELATHAYRHDYPAGSVVFVEGGSADHFALVRQGLIKLDIEVPGRGRVDIETLGPDTVLGWSWLFPPYRWHLGAVAVERTRVLAFDASALRSLMAADPLIGYELMRRFAAVMLDRLQATRLRIGEQHPDVPSAPVSAPLAGIRASAVPPFEVE
jgi:CRP/FNR family transcriptional regulator, cyclic AMP receptor protein